MSSFGACHVAFCGFFSQLIPEPFQSSERRHVFSENGMLIKMLHFQDFIKNKPDGLTRDQAKARSGLMDSVSRNMLLNPAILEKDKQKRPELSPVLFAFLDADYKRKAYRLLKANAEESEKLTMLVFAGSLGLRNLGVFDDKNQLDRLLRKNRRKYIPWTTSCTLSEPLWMDRLKRAMFAPFNKESILDGDWGAKSEQESEQESDLTSAASSLAPTPSTSQSEAVATGTASDDKDVSLDDQDLYDVHWLILKPAKAFAQRGITVLLRRPENLTKAVKHMQSLDHEGGPYDEWVIQEYVTKPVCLSGKAIGTIRTIEPPRGFSRCKPLSPKPTPPSPTTVRRASQQPEMSCVPGKHAPLELAKNNPFSPSLSGRRRSSSVTSSTSLAHTPLRSVHKPLSPSKAQRERAGSRDSAPPDSEAEDDDISAAPEREDLVAKEGQLPAFSGIPVEKESRYKIHYRVYALMVHDQQTMSFKLFVCNTMKLYHASAPYTMAADGATELDPGSSISKYPLLRLSHEVLGDEESEKCLVKFRDIIEDCVTLILDDRDLDAFRPESIAKVSCQTLGFDFLIDESTGKPILLECNTNPGQSLPKVKVMLRQGATPAKVDGLLTYWRGFYRAKFMNDLINVTLDPELGLPTTPDNWWKLVKTFEDPYPERTTVGAKKLSTSVKQDLIFNILNPKFKRRLKGEELENGMPKIPRPRKPSTSFNRISPTAAATRTSFTATRPMPPKPLVVNKAYTPTKPTVAPFTEKPALVLRDGHVAPSPRLPPCPL